MKEQIERVINEMSAELSVKQLRVLQSVLIKIFAENIKKHDVCNNASCLSEFLSAKRVEGCSLRTIKYPALFVTLDYPYSRLKISGVEIRIRELGRAVALDKIHPHKFRRTMATRAIDKGMPIEQVQKILGHSQIDTTMRYALVNQNNVKSSHRRIMA